LNLYAESQSVLENRRMLLPRLSAAAEEFPGLRARACELLAAAGTRKVTLEGASDAIASANLQSRVEELAASVGAAVSSTEGPAEVRGGYHRNGLRYVLVGSYETLVGLLAKFEAATPPLVIDNLHTRGGLRAERRPGRPATPGMVTPALNAGLDVYGFHTNENPVVAKP
jgi:Type II secretion system (T2SS), protein M subtype b